MYRPTPAAQVTTEDLIATIAADRDDVATFEARAEFQKRCAGTRPEDWRTYAPAKPRTEVRIEGGSVKWHNFHEEGLI